MDTAGVGERLYTYQELSGLFQVHYRTVALWFRSRKKFRPTKNTVRIPESAVRQFINEKRRT